MGDLFDDHFNAEMVDRTDLSVDDTSDRFSAGV
jgi:hypothetical protein